MKPTDVINTFMTHGLNGVVEQLGSKATTIKSKIPKHESLVENMVNVMSSQFINEGANQGINKERGEKWDKYHEEMEQKAFDIQKPFESMDIFSKLKEEWENPGSMLAKAFTVDHYTEDIRRDQFR